jgi:hypothetical protein
MAVPSENDRTALTEANTAWQIAMTFESSLIHAYRIGEGDVVMAMARSTNEVAVLTKEFRLSRIPISKLGRADSQNLPSVHNNSKTVRRYSESRLPDCHKLMVGAPDEFDPTESEARLIYTDNKLLLLLKRKQAASIYQIDGHRLNHRASFTNRSLDGSITALGAYGDKVLLSLRERDLGLSLVQVDMSTAEARNVTVELPFARQSPGCELGFRGSKLLLSKRSGNGTEQLWAVDVEGDAELLVDAGGFHWINCFEYLGVAAFGFDSLTDVLDARGGSQAISESPGLELSRFQTIHNHSNSFLRHSQHSLSFQVNRDASCGRPRH